MASAFVEGVVDFAQRLPDRRRLHWERDVATTLRGRMVQAKAGRPVLVALAGMASVGKTTSAEVLRRMLGSDRCLVVGLDGFILPLETLKARRNSGEFIWRRGAMDTYDPDALRTALS